MGSFPMRLREDIVPFFFPCGHCNKYMFHYIVEHPCGLAFKVPFMKAPLASTHKDFFVLCVGCEELNGKIEAGDVTKLMRNILPKSVHLLYPLIRELYNPADFESRRQENLLAMSQADADKIDGFLRRYRLEI